jgi:hypothetical protein
MPPGQTSPIAIPAAGLAARPPASVGALYAASPSTAYGASPVHPAMLPAGGLASPSAAPGTPNAAIMAASPATGNLPTGNAEDRRRAADLVRRHTHLGMCVRTGVRVTYHRWCVYVYITCTCLCLSVSMCAYLRRLGRSWKSAAAPCRRSRSACSVRQKPSA